MRTVRLTANVLLLLMLFAPKTPASEPVSLRGLVLDENGVPVSGAQVKLEGAGPRAISAQTDDGGRFRLANLTPGEYHLRIEKAGFFVLEVKSLSISAESADHTFTLNHEQEVHQQIEVTVSGDRIDPQDTSGRATLQARQIRDIPVPSSHDLRQSLVALPEVLRDNFNLLHIAGARSGQTQYLLDGIEIGNPVTGLLDARFSVDAARSAEVQIGRFGGEYAHSGANILSLETPDGDDRWRFGTTDFIPGLDFQQGPHLGNWYPRFAFSGPLVRGKLWFSESVSLQRTLQIVSQQPPPANGVTQWGGDSLARILWHPVASNVFHSTLLYNRDSDSNLGLDALNPQSTTLDADSHRIFASAKDQMWLHQTMLEIAVAADSSVSEQTPQGTAPYILKTVGSAGNYFERLHRTGKRYQLFANILTASRNWHGTHVLSAGANVSSVKDSQQASRTEIQALRTDGTLSRLTTFAGPSAFRLSNTLLGAYIQDSWTLGKHLIVQAGIRTDWDRLFQSAIAEPRFALNILPFRDGRAKFSLGWGIYNSPLSLFAIGQSEDQQQIDTLYDSSGASPVAGPVASRFVLPQQGLKQPYFLITSTGWQQEFGDHTLVRLELLARDERHGLTYVDEQPGQVGGPFLLHTSRQDRYRAAILSFRHAFTSQAEMFASYTRARTTTNEALSPALGLLFFAPQQSGPLPWDAPDRFLTWGWTPTHIWGTLLSWMFEYRTGYPFNVVDQQQFLIGAPYSRRFPDYASLTLGLEKRFAFRGYIFAARLSLVNALDRNNPDTVVNNIDAPNFLTLTGGQGRAATARLRFVGRK